MPNIREYTSPIDKLAPDEKGYQAWEMAGRRIGPLYTQQASDIKEGGKLQDQLITQAGKLNTDQLDYIGALAKVTEPRPERVVSGGGGSTARPSADRAGPAPVDFANAANTLTRAAGALVQAEKGGVAPGGKAVDAGGTYPGSTTGQNPYDPAATDTGSYSQQAPGGLSDSLTAAQIKTQLAQGDAMFNKDWAGRAINGQDASGGMYAPVDLTTGAGGAVVPPSDPGWSFGSMLSSTVADFAYAGTNAAADAPVADATGGVAP